MYCLKILCYSCVCSSTDKEKPPFPALSQGVNIPLRGLWAHELPGQNQGLKVGTLRAIDEADMRVCIGKTLTCRINSICVMGAGSRERLLGSNSSSGSLIRTRSLKASRAICLTVKPCP